MHSFLLCLPVYSFPYIFLLLHIVFFPYSSLFYFISFIFSTYPISLLVFSLRNRILVYKIVEEILLYAE